MAKFTLDELIKMMEPQARLDKALIARCVDGLGVYAAQIAANDRFSHKIGETRELVETLVSYWGLDEGEDARELRSFLFDFDSRVDDAKSGGAVTDDPFLFDFNVIFGLYRYGSDMLVSQGETAMGDILDVSERMKEIAEAWDFDAAVLGDLTGRLEREVRAMLEKYPMPGQPVSGEDVEGYIILRRVLFDNDRGFALAHRPGAPSPFVTWQITTDGGKLDYYWGRYVGSEERARIDYIARFIRYKDAHRVREVQPTTAAAEMGEELRKPAHETPGNYPAIAALTEKLAGVVDSITAKSEQSYVVDFLDILENTGVDLMQNGALRSAVLDALRAVPEIADFALDKNELTIYRGTEGVEIGSGKFEVFIRNSEETNRGEWLTLPADADTLHNLFDRIGVERAGGFDMPIINTPMPHLLRRHVAGCKNLDELNMLAAFMNCMEDFEVEKLKAILTYKIEDVGYGTAALINLLCDENFDAFRMIPANGAEELGVVLQ
jgi:hypothetical protein